MGRPPPPQPPSPPHMASTCARMGPHTPWGLVSIAHTSTSYTQVPAAPHTAYLTRQHLSPLLCEISHPLLRSALLAYYFAAAWIPALLATCYYVAAWIKAGSAQSNMRAGRGDTPTNERFRGVPRMLLSRFGGIRRWGVLLHSPALHSQTLGNPGVLSLPHPITSGPGSQV